MGKGRSPGIPLGLCEPRALKPGNARWGQQAGALRGLYSDPLRPRGSVPSRPGSVPAASAARPSRGAGVLPGVSGLQRARPSVPSPARVSAETSFASSTRSISPTRASPGTTTPLSSRT